MLKFNECENEEALDMLANLMEPISEMIAKEEVQEVIKADKPKIIIAKTLITSSKKEVIDMLAIMHGVPREEFHINPLQILTDLLEILNIEEVQGLF